MRLVMHRQRRRETRKPGIVRRQPEAQQIAGPVELAAPDALLGKRRMERLRTGMARQPEQRRSADDVETSRAENGIQLARLLAQILARAFSPGDIAQRDRALAGLLADGLAAQVGPDTFALPG